MRRMPWEGSNEHPVAHPNGMTSVRRFLVPTLLSLAALPAPMLSQVDGSVFLVGYGVLSISAIKSLVSRDHPRIVGTGDRVKVRLRGVSGHSGEVRIVKLDADSVSVTSEFDVVAQRFARVDIESLEINVEPHGRWAEGWGIGLLVGGAGGALLGYSACTEDDCFFSKNDSAVIGGIIFGVLGSTAGAVIGLFAPGKWVSSDWESRRVSVAPVVGRRSGLVARFRF